MAMQFDPGLTSERAAAIGRNRRGEDRTSVEDTPEQYESAYTGHWGVGEIAARDDLLAVMVGCQAVYLTAVEGERFAAAIMRQVDAIKARCTEPFIPCSSPVKV